MKKFILFLYDFSILKKESRTKSDKKNLIRIALVNEEPGADLSKVPILTYRLEVLEFKSKEEIFKMTDPDQESIIIERADGPPDEKQIFCKQILPGENYINLPKFTLTPMQRKVMELLTEGLQMKEVAATLNLSYHTVKNHVWKAYEKMEVNSIGEAVERYVRYRNLLN